jgi:hypothetical protein
MTTDCKTATQGEKPLGLHYGGFSEPVALIGLVFLAFFAVETPISAAGWESRGSRSSESSIAAKSGNTLTRLSQLKKKSLKYQRGTPKSRHYRAGAAA